MQYTPLTFRQRLILKAEGLVFLVGGLVLALSYTEPVPPSDSAIARIIQDSTSVLILAAVVVVSGLLLLITPSKRQWQLRIMRSMTFVAFLVHFYVFLAQIFLAESITDVRYINQILPLTVLGVLWLSMGGAFEQNE